MIVRYSRDAVKFLSRYEFVKRLVKAWDADYTKVTPDEARQIEAAEHSGFIDDSDIDWEHLGIDSD